MKSRLCKITLAILALAAFFLSCADSSPLEFQGKEENSSSSGVSSSSSEVPSSSSEMPSSSSEAPSSSSEMPSSSSSNPCDGFTDGTKREHYGKDKSQFCDERDGKKYVYKEIGTQTWMAENLNYNPTTGDSWCYGEDDANCATYGRMYDWATAKEVCPNGWRLPSDADWDILMKSVNPSCSATSDCADAGKLLKTVDEWDIAGGTDIHGFSALPGGYCVGECIETKDFNRLNGTGIWWSSTDFGNKAYRRRIVSGESSVFWKDSDKSSWHSVRCIKGKQEGE